MTSFPLGIHRPEIDPTAYIASGAKLIGDVLIGKHSSVWFNCVLRGDCDTIRIGDKVNIQDGTVCHADEGIPLTVEDEVSVGHMAIIHGCTIGRGALIGMGAIVMNRAQIGEYALIAAGSLVPEGKVIPPRTLAMGSPAKVVRELTDSDIEKMKKTTRSYMERAQVYLAQNIID
jgi:carbonic anhydrase/acetyltransferase-like protein (isoleucine patch superfamily)